MTLCGLLTEHREGVTYRYFQCSLNSGIAVKTYLMIYHEVPLLAEFLLPVYLSISQDHTRLGWWVEERNS